MELYNWKERYYKSETGNKKCNDYTTVHVSTSECLNVCEILGNYIHMIENKQTDQASMQDRHNSWLLVEQEYNCTSTHKMTVETLRQCYRALKCKARNTLSQSKTNLGDHGEFPESESVLFDKVCTLMMGPTVIQSHGSGLFIEDFEGDILNEGAFLKQKLSPRLVTSKKIKKKIREETAEGKALAREKIELYKLKKELIQIQIQGEEEKLLRAQLERAEQEEKTLFSHKICGLKLV